MDTSRKRWWTAALPLRVLDVVVVACLWWLATGAFSAVLALTGWTEGARPGVDLVVVTLMGVVMPVLIVGGYVAHARHSGASVAARMIGRRADVQRPEIAWPSERTGWAITVLVDWAVINVTSLIIAAAVAVPAGAWINEGLTRSRPDTGLEGVALTILVLVVASWLVTAAAYIALGIARGNTPGSRVAARRRR